MSAKLFFCMVMQFGQTDVRIFCFTNPDARTQRRSCYRTFREKTTHCERRKQRLELGASPFLIRLYAVTGVREESSPICGGLSNKWELHAKVRKWRSELGKRRAGSGYEGIDTATPSLGLGPGVALRTGNGALRSRMETASVPSELTLRDAVGDFKPQLIVIQR